MRCFTLTLLLITLAQPAMAWWDTGHVLVARIAWDKVRPETRRTLRELLQRLDQQAAILSDQSPGEPLSEEALRHALEVSEARITLAGLRLARLLDEAVR